MSSEPTETKTIMIPGRGNASLGIDSRPSNSGFSFRKHQALELMYVQRIKLHCMYLQLSYEMVE